ncbi:MAG TPA: hydrogenase expression/formation C-terminal domain-containing protein [Gammaproteobacteria bacterium]|nr:hydrogenase expression/formation C-terminal domain-containing protein [Gammaproteobacteria bacterium]
MNDGLKRINVTVAPQEPQESVLNAWALLNELEQMLLALIDHERPSSIDLRGVPLTAADRRTLERVLGEGEINVEIDALGMSRVRETAVHGVWWVTHHDDDGKTVAEFLEVSYCPDILRSHKDDVRDTLENLRAHLAQHTET